VKSQNTILIADDDISLRHVLSLLLEEEGFSIIQAVDGEECLHKAYEHHPDLVLLDVMMPNKDGRLVCRRLRELSNVPIIMLTCISDEREKVERLGEGADDYVTKPFHNDELIARIKSLLRRTQQDSDKSPHRYDDGFLRIDFDLHQISVGGTPGTLSPKEWRLLEYLLRHRNQIISREDLMRCAWGVEFEKDYGYLKVFISHLRQKLRDPIQHPRYLHTERDQGYRFRTYD
jgi:DNA-binding response OmpR family regulator